MAKNNYTLQEGHLDGLTKADRATLVSVQSALPPKALRE